MQQDSEAEMEEVVELSEAPIIGNRTQQSVKQDQDIDRCSICLEPLETDTEKIWELACRHSFHDLCFGTFMSVSIGSKQPKCPICRAQTSAGGQIRRSSLDVARSQRGRAGHWKAPLRLFLDLDRVKVPQII